MGGTAPVPTVVIAMKLPFQPANYEHRLLPIVKTRNTKNTERIRSFLADTLCPLPVANNVVSIEFLDFGGSGWGKIDLHSPKFLR